MSWLRGFQKVPKQIFLVHGEPQSKIDSANLVKEELGYDCIPVLVNSEYELELSDGSVVSMHEALAEEIDEQKINQTRDELYDIRRRLEDIIYNTNLNFDANESPEKLAKINNLVQELEKSALNLGATIADSNSDDKNIELTEEDLAKIEKQQKEEKKAKKKEK